MGLVDLKDHVVNKVKPRPTTAGKISCAVVLVAFVFGLGTFIGALVHPHMEDFFRSLEIMTLVPNGMNSTSTNRIVPYPQLVFCPMWKEGTILDMQCHRYKHGLADHTTLTPVMIPSALGSGQNCWGFNTAGTDMPDWQYVMRCEINSTNTNSMGQSWDGRVRVYVDPPNTLNDFQGCQYCVDGIDGTLVVQNYHTVAYWQANYFAARINQTLHHRTDYKTESTRVPFSTGRPERAGMTFMGGFFTPSIWVYERPDVVFTGNSFRGEEFVFRIAFVACVVLISYLLWSCLSSAIILVVVGEEGLAQQQQSQSS